MTKAYILLTNDRLQAWKLEVDRMPTLQEQYILDVEQNYLKYKDCRYALSIPIDWEIINGSAIQVTPITLIGNESLSFRICRNKKI